MPRGNGLSLVWLRIDVEAPAAACPKVFWIATAGLCCTTVFVVVVTTPFTCVVPAGVTRAPPVMAVAICCAVGVAMPRVISDWRTLSSVCAICSVVIVPDGVNVTLCVAPVGKAVASVMGFPEANPFTRLSKFAWPPANATSCGARRCTWSGLARAVVEGSVCTWSDACGSALVLRAKRRRSARVLMVYLGRTPGSW